MAQEKYKFTYHIKDKDENYRTGTIPATSANALKANFEAKGYTFLEEPEEVPNSGLQKELTIGGPKRVKPREVALFARKFSGMQDAGIPVKKILNVLGNAQGVNPTLKKAIEDLQERINAGSSLSDAMSNHPLIFSDLMVAMTRAGEEGGFLDKSLRQVSENLEAEVKLKSKIKSAMTYPVVVLIMALLMCTGMLLFIVPVFSTMFESLGASLPMPTQILKNASDFLKVGIVPLAGAIFAFSVWWRKNKHKLWIRNIKDPITLKLPIVGMLSKKIIMSRFSRNFGTLLENGVPIMRSIDIVAATTGSIVVERALAIIKVDLQRGITIGDALAKHAIFPVADVEMIRVGDDSGDVVPMLNKIADIYDQDVEATTEALTSLIEPLMIVFLGSVVGAMIIALYMPIFTIYDAIKKQG